MDFHAVFVEKCLEKEGWKITVQYLYEIKDDDFDFEIDLAAEELLGAEREGRKMR